MVCCQKVYRNLDTTNVAQSVTNNSPQYALNIGYVEKHTEESRDTKSLSLHIDNHLNRENHADHMIPKLSRACYAVRSMFPVSNTDTIKQIHFPNFHSIMKYGIIFVLW
jgi:hypothetical protein